MAHKDGYEYSDINFETKLRPHKGGGGAWVYLTREHLAVALGLGHDGKPDLAGLRARRTALEPGSGQILIRILHPRGGATPAHRDVPGVQ